ncbi:MAG: sensor histidine kinase [Actinomycetota bacterium]
MDASPSSPPRLVRHFAVASLAAFLLIGTALTFVTVRAVRDRAEDHAAFHANYVVDSVLAPSLEGASPDRPVTGPQLAELDRVVNQRILSDGRTVRLKIWSPDGQVLYSDDHALIGRTFASEKSELRDVLAGDVENGVSDLQAPENVAERSLADKLFETYLPLRTSPGTKPVAVVELYQDYSAIQGEINALVRVLVAVFSIGLILLYAALLPIAAKAARTLRRQNDQLRSQADQLESLLSREQQTVAELRNLNEMQTDFVAAASHELRTPLTSVLGYVRTIRQSRLVREDPASAEEFLASAEHQATRLSLLVRRLLSTAALEQGERSTQASAFDIAELVSAVLRDLPSGAARVRFHADGAVGARSDRDRLHEVLLNLVENALKYSPAKSTVEVTARTENEDLVIDVTDHGIGISPEDQRHIFDRFHQVDQSATRRFGGLGLGLYLAEQICRDLGGSISVRSEPGHGSTFTVRIPAVAISAEALSDASTA